LELRGHGRILAADNPVLKGRLFLFHRYPDGVFLSIPAEEVLGIATTTVKTDAEGFRPGETILLGPTGEGRAPEPKREPGIPEDSMMRSDFPYGVDLYGCCGPGPRPPRPPVPPPPALVGPNGFPLAPGIKPPEIGPNGFPILAPTPIKH
jgi:hypothetical protein